MKSPFPVIVWSSLRLASTDRVNGRKSVHRRQQHPGAGSAADPGCALVGGGVRPEGRGAGTEAEATPTMSADGHDADSPVNIDGLYRR